MTIHSGDTAITFFRQSGWLVMATVSGGFFMMATQMVAIRWMAPTEYSVWFALLRIYLLMSIPSAGLQIVFAQQTAAAVTDEQHRLLAHTIRASLRATFIIWLVIAAVAFAGQSRWIGLLKISNPVALWVTVLIGLASLWSPIVKGILQGLQNFAGLGRVLIFDGVGRFTAIFVILLLGGQAAGGMIGALIGQCGSMLLGGWLIRHLLRAAGQRLDWRPWLRRVVPLSLGIGAVTFMSSADVVYVQSVFPAEQTALYTPAAMIGLAMITFTLPMASVMFPKIVRSVALTRDTRALRQALVATALLGIVAAASCTLMPKLPLQIISLGKAGFSDAAPLVPWYAWSLCPLILANVLLSNLLARERFAVVPWAVAATIGYVVALFALRPWLLTLEPMTAFRAVIQTLGTFSLLLFALALWFTWKEKARAAAPAP